MVKRKSGHDTAKESDGDRILVTRYWPRGVSNERFSATDWPQNLSPSKELVRDLKEPKISWEEYTLRYHEEIRSQRETARKASFYFASTRRTLELQQGR